ncbi:MAG TPA: hypothetical protein VKF62_05940, partial [Planctomycetota bacterium]|nr:hypothetical protein [Planctomycetota bacterium]
AGDPTFQFDNVGEEVTVGGDALCRLLSQEFGAFRILGRSERKVYPTSVIVAFTGCNPTISGDVVRRLVRCRLDSREEHPELRRFDFDPFDRALERRSALVSAGLTLLRAYIAAERPTPLEPLGSYELWSRMVREPLVWAGVGDPVRTQEGIQGEDPERERHGEALRLWCGIFREEERQVRQLPRELAGDDGNRLSEILRNGDREWSGEKVGKLLRKWADRPIGGLVVRRGTDAKRGWWRVEKVGGSGTSGGSAGRSAGGYDAGGDGDRPF